MAGQDHVAARNDSASFSAEGAADLPAQQIDAALPAGLVHDDEVIILLLRPSPLYIVLASAGSLVFIAMIAFGLAYLTKLPWVHWTDQQAFGLGIGLACLRLGWQGLEWWSRLYVLTDRRVIRRKGVLRVMLFEAPLRNIAHTGVFTRVRERVFGLGTIGFATAGSDGFEAFWAMIAQPYDVHRTVTQAIERYGRG
jgi:hypothetical protein